MAFSLDIPSKHAYGGGREVGDGAREVVSRVVGGGNESGINCSFEVSLYQLFMHFCSEHLCYIHSTYIPS